MDVRLPKGYGARLIFRLDSCKETAIFVSLRQPNYKDNEIKTSSTPHLPDGDAAANGWAHAHRRHVR